MDPAVNRIRRAFAELHRRTWREEAARERGFVPSPLFPLLRDDRYRWLFSGETCRLVQKAIDIATNPVEREALKRLLYALKDLYIDYAATRISDEEVRILHKAKLRIDGEPVDYLDTPHILATHPSREWRSLVDARAHRWWLRRIAPQDREAIRSKLTRMARLGVRRPLDYFQESMNMPFWQLRDVAAFLMKETQEPYERLVLPHLRRRFGKGLRDIGDEQLDYCFGMHHLDPLLGVDPDERSRDWFEGVLKLSLDSERLRVDVEERSKKTSRAMCIPVDAPREVVLIIRPISSFTNHESNLHEKPHALHGIHTDQHLPFEHRNLPRNNGVSETYAFLGHNSLQEPDFTRWYFRVKKEVAEEIALSAMIVDILKLRIHCARLEFQFHFFDHPMDNVANQRAYVRLMRHAQPFQVTPSRYLEDAWEWEDVSYLPAWLLDAQIRQTWWRRYGRRWFLREEVGRELLKLYRWGESISIFDLAYRLGTSPWDAQPLIQRYRAGLNLAERRKGR